MLLVACLMFICNNIDIKWHLNINNNSSSGIIHKTQQQQQQKKKNSNELWNFWKGTLHIHTESLTRAYHTLMVNCSSKAVPYINNTIIIGIIRISSTLRHHLRPPKYPKSIITVIMIPNDSFIVVNSYCCWWKARQKA